MINLSSDIRTYFNAKKKKQPYKNEKKKEVKLI